MHEAISIDSPAIMDYMNSWEYSDGLSEQDLHLLQKLSANIPDNAIEKLMAEEKISDILKMLSEVTIGKVIKNEDGDFFWQMKKCIILKLEIYPWESRHLQLFALC